MHATHRVKMIVLTICLLFLTHGWLQAQEVQETADSLRAVLGELIARNSEVHGGWVDVQEEPPRFVINVVTDRKQAAPAMEGIASLFEQVVPDAERIITLKRFPVSEIVERLKRGCREDPQLEGCSVSGGTYIQRTGEDVRFHLDGTYARVGQDVALNDLCESILADYDWSGEAGQPHASTVGLQVRQPDVEEVLKRLQAGVERSETLTGCQITNAQFVKLPEETILELSGWIAFSNQQTEITNLALEALLEFYRDSGVDPPRPGIETLEIRHPPADGFVNLINNELDGMPAFKGCLISAAEYGPDGDTLVLIGRIASAAQLEIIVNLVNEEILPGEFGEGVPLTVQLPGRLQVLEPSETVAIFFFNLGIRRFRCGDYVAAQDAFRRAILEAPDRPEFEYWLVVAEIGGGNLESAYARIRPLTNLRRSPGAHRYNRALRSLESVQGPIRQTMLQLEERAFREGPEPSNG